jgi:hypothetical protein
MSATPPPWSVTVWDQGILIYGGPDGDDIADFSFADQHVVSISKDEAIANATLCVAAHDLLEASQAVIAAWYNPEFSSISDPIDALRATIAMFGPITALRAAISKATTVAP